VRPLAEKAARLRWTSGWCLGTAFACLVFEWDNLDLERVVVLGLLTLIGAYEHHEATTILRYIRSTR